jgi:hypothetical protein
MVPSRKNGKNILYTLTPEEKRQLCIDWRQSGLSQSAFMRERGLPSVFTHWCKKFLSRPKDNSRQSKATEAGLADNDWLSINSICADMQHTPISNGERLIEFSVKCNDMSLSFGLPIFEVVNFIKELSNATTVIR